jgi:hypothetical protein
MHQVRTINLDSGTFNARRSVTLRQPRPAHFSFEACPNVFGAALSHQTAEQPSRSLQSTGKQRVSARRRLNSSPIRWDSLMTGIGCERLPGHRPCPGATTPRFRAAGVAGSLGTGEKADMAHMGEGRRDREEGCPQGPRIFVEPRRQGTTEMLVSRCGGRR